jgi:uncharacterized membrane protein
MKPALRACIGTLVLVLGFILLLLPVLVKTTATTHGPVLSSEEALFYQAAGIVMMLGGFALAWKSTGGKGQDNG